jgi:hypothetical protein
VNLVEPSLGTVLLKASLEKAGKTHEKGHFKRKIRVKFDIIETEVTQFEILIIVRLTSNFKKSLILDLFL